MTSFKDKTIWITGASSGIGEALALAFAREGARLILSARTLPALERVREACLRHTHTCEIYPLDLGEHEDVARVAKAVQARFPKIDIMVHNGGISQRSLAKDTAFSVYKRLIDVDYLGTVALTQALLPAMLTHHIGHFVVISSLVGKFGTPYRSGYAAAKHALHGYFDALRAEVYASNIHVTLICPGFIRTRVSYNALTGDGSPLNQLDEAQAQGMSAERFAQKALRAIRRKRLEVNIGGPERYAVWLKRFFPALFARRLRTAKVR